MLAICVGASLGALLRRWLGTQLNSLFPTLPPGALTVNLLGGFIIGIAIAFLREGNTSTVDAGALSISLHVTNVELQRRHEAGVQPALRYRLGVLGKYVRRVATESKGAVTDRCSDPRTPRD